jgi:hypothetical protein
MLNLIFATLEFILMNLIDTDYTYFENFLQEFGITDYLLSFCRSKKPGSGNKKLIPQSCSFPEWHR